MVRDFIEYILDLMPTIYFTFQPFKILEYQELLKGITLSNNKIVLDLGCGDGLHSILLGKKVQSVFGIDPDPVQIARARQRLFSSRVKNVKFIQGNLENQNLPSVFFDKVFSFCVLEHIPNYIEILTEIYRILKPGGQFIFSVDSLETIENPILVQKHQYDHKVITYFKKETLQKTLKQIGFQQIRITALFRSEFARDIFSEGIKKQFLYTKIQLFLNLFVYLRLKFEEKLSKKKSGIFLVIQCKK